MIPKYNMVLSRDLKPGMTIAQPVIFEKGQVLLEKGVVITNEIIEKFANWGILDVAIESSHASLLASSNFFNTYNETLDLVVEFFGKVRRFKEVPIAECKELAENYIELMIDIEGILDKLYRIKTHHEYTFTHSLHVSVLSGLLGKWMGFKGAQLKNIILTGLLHDIGKTFVPQKILDAPRLLTDEEMKIVRLHSNQGYKLISDYEEFSPEIKIGVLQHHEKEDGSGYPFGLHGKDLNICAKFVAVTDVYDAMTTERVYRKKISPFGALNIMLTQMRDKLDLVACLTLSAKLRESLIGMHVLLNNGKKGKVVQMTNISTARPVIRLENGFLLDLDTDEAIKIVTVLE